LLVVVWNHPFSHLFITKGKEESKNGMDISIETKTKERMSGTPRRHCRNSSVVEAHHIYLKYHQHDNDDDSDGYKDAAPSSAAAYAGTSTTHLFPQFHTVEKTGVIYATSRANSRGFGTDVASTLNNSSNNNGSSKDGAGGWSNMGQGAPETGPLPGAPSRDFFRKSDIFSEADLEYAPCVGMTELRGKVAAYYNHLYRRRRSRHSGSSGDGTGTANTSEALSFSSQYTADNVCIVPGGRAGISRIMAVLGTVQVGFFTPDYTAYEQALGLYLRVSPSPFVHRDVNEASMDPAEFDFQCRGRGVGAVLMSNPANPTGQSIEGDNLRAYVQTARDHNVALIMDEFYSHYYYDGPEDSGGDDDDDNDNWPKTVSSAAYVEDVNRDPVLIVNGLTKNWRCPGFRICWIVGPAPIVKLLGAAGSYLDGGANAPLQRLALPLLDLDFVRRDAWALQKHFKVKRDFLLRKLEELGFVVKVKICNRFFRKKRWDICDLWLKDMAHS
jgi:aspartate/methionine/tyrosine aminotransferase